MKYRVTETGDGYVSFREVVSNMLIAETYALTINNVWRFRAPGQQDLDFVPAKSMNDPTATSHAKADAVAHAKAYVQALGYTMATL